MGRILVIEDDPGNQLLYRSRLKDLGHEVVVSGTGAQGIAEARSSAYDLYLVDMHLGEGVDGIEVCSRLKRDPETRNVPVVLISMKIRSRADLHRGYEAGCEAFLIKNDATLVEDVVRAMLRIKSLQDELASQMALLQQRNERLHEALRDKADLEDQLKQKVPSSSHVASEMVIPDGILLADTEGTVVSADRGAQELFAKRVEGKSLGSLAPGTRFEAFVRDVHHAAHHGFQFSTPARGSRIAQHLVACAFPLVPRNGSDGVLRVVLLWDAGRHATAWAALQSITPGTVLPEQGVLQEVARREYTPDRILGDTAEIVEIRSRARELAFSTEPVLITGEAGVGKSFLARTLHFSGTRTGDFVPVGCADLPREELEAHLLGDEDQPGLLVRANGGTLHLQDFEQVPLRVQKRIVEVLRGGLELGSKKKRPLDVRLIASSCRSVGPADLDDEFREFVAQDPIELPPLRLRIPDVASIAGVFALRSSGGHHVEITDSARFALEGYEWPGNVQELENVIARAVSGASEPGILDVADLPAPLPDVFERMMERGQVVPSTPPLTHVPGTHQPATTALLPEGFQMVLDELLSALPESEEEQIPASFDFFEKWALKFALAQTEGDKLKAAKLLQVGKSTLYRKLHKYEI